MNLQMFINDKLIGNVQIDQEHANSPEYIYQKKKELEEKHKEILEASGAVPTYFMEIRSTTENRRRRI